MIAALATAGAALLCGALAGCSTSAAPRAMATPPTRKATADSLMGMANLQKDRGADAASRDYVPAFDLWPLGRYWTSPDHSVNQGEVLWPFFEWQNTPDFHQFYFHPFYATRTDKLTGLRESETLWPFGFGTNRSDLDRTVIFPLFLHDHETTSEGEPTSRTVLLPLFYRQTKTQNQPADWLVFPLAGSFHNFMGRQRIVIVLWPLYIYQAGKDVRSWSFLYPIFGRIRWDDGGSGFKMWPLFGWNTRPNDRLNKQFILWPIWQYQHAIQPEGEFKRWWVFPFYGRIEDPRGEETAILWPFFSHRTDRNVPREDWWYPWPVLGHHTGAQGGGRTFWPVFSWDKEPERTTASFLWPLGWYRQTEQGAEQTSSTRLLPLFFVENEKKGEQRTGAWQIWPLVKRRAEADSTHLEIPSLLPVRWYAPWERNFAPLFRVFEYHRSAEQTRSWRALWRLVRVDSGPRVSYVEVTPLFRVGGESSAPGASGGSILKGLVGWDRTDNGLRWRVLYFIRFGGTSKAKTP